MQPGAPLLDRFLFTFAHTPAGNTEPVSSTNPQSLQPTSEVVLIAIAIAVGATGSHQATADNRSSLERCKPDFDHGSSEGWNVNAA